MTFTLDNATCFDVETLPNVFTLSMEMLNNDLRATWEISEFRDDRYQLMQWFTYLGQEQAGMISFNGIHFDYPVIHYLYHNPQCTFAQIYEHAMAIIRTDDRFGFTIWPNDRFTPQIDLFKIHHFDNRNKTTSLKALQVNMRSPSVVDSPIEFGTNLTRDQINNLLIPYNVHDVTETKRFAQVSRKAIDFRIKLIDQFGIEALNFNDGKIGAETLKQRLGDEICYDRSSGRKMPRQTPRWRIALRDIIFPYIRFNNPEFQRVLEYMKQQTLTPEDIDDPDSPLKTKGAIKISAHVGGIEFKFGTGGVHASIENQHVFASGPWKLRDIDVAGMYPAIAIVNKLAPAHLGEAFTSEYAKIPIERKLYPKGTVENAGLKLAANVPWGQSINKFSVFFDPQYGMTVPINGQLMICMLAEWLLDVPTLKLIQVNTDGITYYIHDDYEPQAVEICKHWQAYTLLELEDTDYAHMWIKNVNNYVAQDIKGKLKQKGDAYWHPDPHNYYASISEASPPAWHKDLGGVVIQRAAVAAMVQGIDPDAFIRTHSDPFDFMLRVRVDRASHLMLGGVPVQSTCRYYVAKSGSPLVKRSPPSGPLGQYKRKNGVSDLEARRIADTLPPDTWDERIHTKNKSRYENRETAIQAGWKVALCNDARDFQFNNIDYNWYVAEARKLIVA